MNFDFLFIPWQKLCTLFCMCSPYRLCATTKYKPRNWDTETRPFEYLPTQFNLDLEAKFYLQQGFPSRRERATGRGRRKETWAPGLTPAGYRDVHNCHINTHVRCFTIYIHACRRRIHTPTHPCRCMTVMINQSSSMLRVPTGASHCEERTKGNQGWLWLWCYCIGEGKTPHLVVAVLVRIH